MLLPRMRVKSADKKQKQVAGDQELRHAIVVFVTALMVVQFMVSDWYVLFLMPDDAANTIVPAWLASTCVEIIGVMLVVARSLFPGKTSDSGNGNDGAGHESAVDGK